MAHLHGSTVIHEQLKIIITLSEELSSIKAKPNCESSLPYSGHGEELRYIKFVANIKTIMSVFKKKLQQ